MFKRPGGNVQVDHPVCLLSRHHLSLWKRSQAGHRFLCIPDRRLRSRHCRKEPFSLLRCKVVGYEEGSKVNGGVGKFLLGSTCMRLTRPESFEWVLSISPSKCYGNLYEGLWDQKFICLDHANPVF